jgi:hypothetical protein
MPLNEFWHGDMELMVCYQIAYERNVTYTSWINGARVFEAISKAIFNGFGKKNGQSPEQYSDYKDPFERKVDKPIINEDNIDEIHLQQQIEGQYFLMQYLNKEF